MSDIPRISFNDLEDHHCRFICTSEPQGPTIKQFCGEKRIPGLAYCQAHALRCGEQTRISRPFDRPKIGRVMLNTNGSLRDEMESA